jgi:hypothetical protein
VAPHQKPSRRDSVSTNETQGAFEFDRGDGDGVGCTVVEGLGSGERAACECEVDWAPRQKPSRRGSILADDLRGELLFEPGDISG